MKKPKIEQCKLCGKKVFIAFYDGVAKYCEIKYGFYVFYHPHSCIFDDGSRKEC